MLQDLMDSLRDFLFLDDFYGIHPPPKSFEIQKPHKILENNPEAKYKEGLWKMLPLISN